MNRCKRLDFSMVFKACVCQVINATYNNSFGFNICRACSQVSKTRHWNSTYVFGDTVHWNIYH